MRRPRLSLVTLALLAFCPTRAPGAEPDAASRPGRDGWVSLFNGKDLAGWLGDRSVWKVEGGCIVGRAAHVPQNTFLIHTGEFHDFNLRADWKITNAGRFPNSGIQFRCRVADPRRWTVSGYQLDIGDGHFGDLHDELGRSLLAAGAPEAQKAVIRDGWNRSEIRTAGARVTLILNGVVSADWIERDPKRFVHDGRIALQYHYPGDGFEIRYRDVRIQPLDRPPATATAPKPPTSTVNLLALVNPKRDGLSGRWTLTAGTLTGESAEGARLEIPFKPPEEYDYLAEFTRTDSDETVILLFSHGGKSLAWALGAFGNTACAFLPGPPVAPDDHGKWLAAGKRHVAIVRVRKEGVQGFLDGNLISAHDYASLGDPNWSTRDPSRLGLAHKGTTSYFRVELTPVNVPPARPASPRGS